MAEGEIGAGGHALWLPYGPLISTFYVPRVARSPVRGFVTRLHLWKLRLPAAARKKSQSHQMSGDAESKINHAAVAQHCEPID